MSQSLRNTIRVFISSTFQDMVEERNYLMKYTFPEIRKFCLERGLDFVPIDLRWGITQEQAERGESKESWSMMVQIGRTNLKLFLNQ